MLTFPQVTPHYTGQENMACWFGLDKSTTECPWQCNAVVTRYHYIVCRICSTVQRRLGFTPADTLDEVRMITYVNNSLLLQLSTSSTCVLDFPINGLWNFIDMSSLGTLSARNFTWFWQKILELLQLEGFLPTLHTCTFYWMCTI